MTIIDIGQNITRILCACKGLFKNCSSLQNVKDLAYKFNIPEGLRISATIKVVERSQPTPLIHRRGQASLSKSLLRSSLSVKEPTTLEPLTILFRRIVHSPSEPMLILFCRIVRSPSFLPLCCRADHLSRCRHSFAESSTHLSEPLPTLFRRAVHSPSKLLSTLFRRAVHSNTRAIVHSPLKSRLLNNQSRRLFLTESTDPTSIIAIKTKSQQAANMAAARAPMVDPPAEMAALTAANSALQGQVANLQPGITAPTSAIYTRTLALRDKTDLLDFRKTENWNIYEDGRSSVLSGDNCFDAMAEQLMPFINAFNRRATDMGWNDATNPQQITLFDIPHHSTTAQINLVTSYGCISLTDLRTQCACFMIGSNANQRASQNNQMLQECIWNSITPLVQQRLAQYKTEYTLGHHLCGTLLIKVIIRMSTMDSRAIVSIL